MLGSIGITTANVLDVLLLFCAEKISCLNCWGFFCFVFFPSNQETMAKHIFLGGDAFHRKGGCMRP